METEARENDALCRGSAASRVFGIEELVNIVFGFLNRPDNARNAQVCKTWSEIALKIIWTEVDDFHALFSILAPLIPGDDARYNTSVYSFAHLPCAAGWRRFDHYAVLVRTLVYRSRRKPISRAVLRDIAQTRTRFNIFPNLHTLKWDSVSTYLGINQPDIPIPSDSFLFMHAGIKSLEFYLYSSIPLLQATEFLDGISQRMPCLTAIIVHTDVRAVELEGHYCALLLDLPLLQRVSLPKSHFTTRIAEVLAASPTLRTLHIGLPWNRGADAATPVVFAGGFPALKTLRVAMTFADAALLLDAVSTENGLDTLHISTANPSRHNVKRVLEICANKHRQIQQLGLRCYNEQHLPLNFQTLYSLKKLSSLTVLDIAHRSPIVMSLSNLISIISSLTQLTRLGFNHSPLYCETACFGLDILPVITRSCKHLTALTLFLDATLPLPDEESYIRGGFCENLTFLSLGISVITEETCHRAAMFLSTHLPVGCNFHYGALWISTINAAGPHEERRNIANKRIQLWAQVKSLIQLLNKVRIQERKWASAS